ncbi:MAG: Holliday junction branch migration protein RuvA [Actinomycetota bacterium]
MIASVAGVVRQVRLDAVVIEVGGVGVLVHAGPRALADLREGSPASLVTSLIVREDSLTLYGFIDEAERVVFEAVQTVSGVGPRLALAMLAVHTPQELRRAVATDDIPALRTVPGVGLKGAQRLALELKGKLGSLDAAAPTHPAELGGTDAWRDHIREALVGLGWAVKAADEAIRAVAPVNPGQVDVPAVLRAALQYLGRS